MRDNAPLGHSRLTPHPLHLLIAVDGYIDVSWLDALESGRLGNIPCLVEQLRDQVLENGRCKYSRLS
jgi:hypothetical protein